LLDDAGMQYAYLTADKRAFGNIMKMTGSKMVPQIVIDGKFIGDINNLKEYL
jgi:glutaredoxin|tara:strand:+ start:524 stop:679 length:156 start_codon:yes stop_codon:yes gene_type:complete